MSRKAPSLASRVGRLDFATCVMNGPGPRSATDEDLELLARSRSGGIAIKSATMTPRGGDPDAHLAIDEESYTALYTDDLENLGYRAHAAQASELRARHRKPVIASVNGFTADEFARMAETLGQSADAVELNLSCPSFASTGLLASDPGTTARVLAAVRRATEADIWVKLPPYQEITQLEEMADLLRRSRVQAVVAINGPAGLDVDIESETTVVLAPDGMTALGGRELLRIARWNIREFHRMLGDEIAVVGSGGVVTGEDVYGHVLCGATLVQVGTAYFIEGPSIFQRLERELSQLLKKKGVASIAEKIGALVER